jgi:hypothetical protein
MTRKHSSHTRFDVEYAEPSFGIAIQICPTANGPLHREHPDFFKTGTRFGLPFVLPINDGTGPLGLIFVIF